MLKWYITDVLGKLASFHIIEGKIFCNFHHLIVVLHIDDYKELQGACCP
jgi:hypothetical protein